MTRLDRRGALKLGAGALGAVATASAAGSVALAQAGVLKIVFPFGAGGGGDGVSRLLGEQIAPAVGKSVIVENKTGADGRIGIMSVKTAPPDGSTVLLTTGPTMALMPLVHKAPGYDPFADFEPIIHATDFEFCIAVAKDNPAQSLAELTAWLKANPDKGTYGVPGLGTIPYFTGLSFAKHYALDLKRLPYRGGSPAIQDLVGAQIQVVVGTVADALAQHEGGNIRILATSAAQRSPFLPNVPTFTESGFPLAASAWYGVWAPAKTPKADIEMLNAAMNAALAKPDVRARLMKLGVIPRGGSPADLTREMRQMADLWAPVIKESGFTLAN